jgi:NAD(P)-dependent dehydrogenase (short-subunit alcohol dehydrogenase family)
MNILITGGASGLGEAITKKLAETPANNIYFTYHNSEKNAREIESFFGNAHGIRCNFNDQENVISLQDKIGILNIDILINNAYEGSFIKSYFHKTSAADYLSEFQKNIIPSIQITQSAIQIFRKKKFGKIITVLTSALVNTPPTGASIYVANKAYMKELTKVWASENAKFNISSNSVSPALMQTNFTNGLDERIVDDIKEQHPLKTILKVEEVADTIAFLAYASQQINGVNIVINSGANIE